MNTLQCMIHRRSRARGLPVAAGMILLVAASITRGGDFSWTDAAGVATGDFSDDTHWDPTGGPPGVGDTAGIALGAVDPYTVTLDVDATVDAFTLDDANATFAAAGRTFTVNGPSVLYAGDVLWQSSTWTGTGTLTNHGSMLLEGDGSTIGAPIDQYGTLLLRNNASSVDFTLTDGSTNYGQMTIDATGLSSLRINVSGGTGARTLVNAASGVIELSTEPGPTIGSGRTIVLSGNLTNEGTLNVNGWANLGGLHHRNTGVINIAADIGDSYTGALRLDSTTFDHDAGTLNVGGAVDGWYSVFNLNGGAVDVNGAFRLSDSTFNLTGGVVTGNSVDLEDCALAIGPAATGAASFTLTGESTLSGSIADGQTIRIGAPGETANVTTDATGLTNSGRLAFVGDAVQELEVPGGTLTNTATGVIEFKADSVAPSLQSGGVGNLVNDGLVDVQTGGGWGGEITNNNTFRIGPDAEFLVGTEFSQESGQLDNQGTFHFYGGTFRFSGGRILGNAPILQDAMLEIGPGAVEPARFVLASTGTILGGALPAGHTVYVRSLGSWASKLEMTDDFTNAGTITLDAIDVPGAAHVKIAEGKTLTNIGTINVDPGSGGERYIQGNLTNDGIVNLNTRTTPWSTVSTVFTNNGQFNITSDGTLDLEGGNRAFNQSNGTLNVEGELLVAESVFNFNGGTITGVGPTLVDSTLNIAPTATGAGRLTLRGQSTLSGSIQAGQEVILQEHASLWTRFTSPSGLANAGTIVMESTTDNGTVRFVVSGGALENAASGVFSIKPGPAGAQFMGREITADITNDGTINVDTDAYISGSAHTNRGSLNVADGAELEIRGVGTVFNQDDGTIHVAEGGVVETRAEGFVFNQSGGTLQIDGEFLVRRWSESATFNFDGGTISGNGVTLSLADLNIAPTATGSAVFTVVGNTTIHGNIGQTHTIILEDLASLDDGATNSGTIRFRSISSAIAVPGDPGTFTNAETGYLDLTGNLGEGRRLFLEFNNQGTMDVGAANLLVLEPDANHVNSGAFDLLEAGGYRRIRGSTFTNDVGGLIRGVGELDVSEIQFTNHGEVSPGLGLGVLDILGDYTQSDTGLLSIEIGGLLAGETFDVLDVSGTATLAGTLDLALVDSFEPQLGDMFEILTFDSRVGVFDTMLGDMIAPDLYFHPIYGSDRLTLRVVPEPTALALIGVGVAGLLRRRR